MPKDTAWFPQTTPRKLNTLPDFSPYRASHPSRVEMDDRVWICYITFLVLNVAL